MDKVENLVLVASLEEAIRVAKETDCKEAFIIGGGEVYRQSMNLADCIYMTRVQAQYPDADTFFGEIDAAVFSLTDSHDHPADEKHSHAFVFQTWERIHREAI